MYCPSIYLEALTKTNKDIRSSGPDSKRVLHEYSLELLLLDPVCAACTRSLGCRKCNLRQVELSMRGSVTMKTCVPVDSV